MNVIQTTKLSPHEKKLLQYKYYAGFSANFVETIIDFTTITPRSIVLDPWNGSGTTTTVCSRRGIRSVGLDINPFMRIPATYAISSIDQIRTTLERMLQYFPGSADLDRKVPLFRALADFAAVLMLNADCLPDVIHFIMAQVARQLSKQAKSRNPTWFRTSDIGSIEFQLFEINQVVRRVVELQLKDIGSRTSPICVPDIITEDFVNWEIPSDITHLISSPPYLTRIDYVQKTLPELMYISHFHDFDLNQLRRRMIGSVLTRNTNDQFEGGGSALFKYYDILQRIKSHPSKASSGYYFRFYEAYFSKMRKCISRIVNSSIEEVVFVTQGSYYKDLFIDLPDLLADVFVKCGAVETRRFIFPSTNSMVTINSGSFASRQNLPSEIVSVFKVR